MTERKTVWICLSLFTQRHTVKVKHLVFNWLVGKDIHGSWGMNSNDFCFFESTPRLTFLILNKMPP